MSSGEKGIPSEYLNLPSLFLLRLFLTESKQHALRITRDVN